MHSIHSLHSTLTLLCLLFTLSASGQFILAGEHGAGVYYKDIEPDTVITGPYVHIGGQPAAVYPLDMDADDTTEFLLYAYGSWSGGLSYKDLYIKTYNEERYQLACDSHDTCYYSGNPYYARPMVKWVRAGDSISASLPWQVNQGNLFWLEWNEWSALGYNCTGQGFTNEPDGNFIPVRVLRSGDTLYGWIQVTNVGQLTVTVMSFALQLPVNGVDEPGQRVRIWPVPAAGTVKIETDLDGFELVMSDLNGKPMLSRTTDKRVISLNTAHYPPGFYLLQIRSGSRVINKKLVLTR